MFAVSSSGFNLKSLVEQCLCRLVAVMRLRLTGPARVGADWTGLSVRSDPRGAEIDALRDKIASLERALQSQCRSIALTSHELRTPLNGIIGLTELLDQTTLRAEQRSYLDAIAISARALRTLVDDLLDEGKIAAGHWRVTPKPVAIEALVEEVVELLAPRAQAKGLELAAHVTAQVPGLVSIDPHLLVRILMNLIGNAIKFTEHGGIAIDVAVARTTPQTVELVFSVSDTGIGIAPADQPRIFAEYEQAHDAITSTGGTGLGLAISRTIARALGGTLALESEPERGSTFSFSVEIPIIRAERGVEKPFGGRHILLVSDGLIEPGLLMRRLFDLGASVELVRDIPSARQRLVAKRTFDVLIIDYGQHHMIELGDLANAKGADHPPVAVMMTPANRHELDGLKALGIDGHLVKPMRTASLIKVLGALMIGQTLIPPVEREDKSPQLESGGGLKILLVDDNEINVLLARSQLHAYGSVDVATNGADAIARVEDANNRHTSYGVIIMDLHMPVMDGFTAIAGIRRSEQKFGQRSYIVALTADITRHSAEKALSAGADATLTKPIDQTHLRQLIGNIPAIQAGQIDRRSDRAITPGDAMRRAT